MEIYQICFQSIGQLAALSQMLHRYVIFLRGLTEAADVVGWESVSAVAINVAPIDRPQTVVVYSYNAVKMTVFPRGAQLDPTFARTAVFFVNVSCNGKTACRSIDC